ncbi:MAG TPA: hypothetical protein VL984_14955 [Acidimicrobiales bacterium]|nr:hypothetical protein [Acidimicrobiales bacterium]
MSRCSNLVAAVLAVAGSLSAGPLSAGPLSAHTGAARPIVPQDRPWALAHVTTVQSSLEAPVGLSGAPYAYSLEVASVNPIPPEARLVRIDLSTGQVDHGPGIPSTSGLVVVGKKVAAITPGGYLRFVDGLELGAAIKLDWRPWILQQLGSPMPLVDGAIWLPELHSAVLVSVTTGKVLKVVGFRAMVSDLAESPDGERLYVALDEVSVDVDARVSTVIDEFDASTARLLGHHDIESGVGPAQLTPVEGGVWAAYRTGMAGTIVLLSSKGLTQLPFPRPVKEFSTLPQYGSGQIMGYWASYLGGDLWLQSYRGASCVAPRTGRLLEGTTKLHGTAIFAVWKGLVYTSGFPYSGSGSGQIMALRPPAGCHIRS